MPSQGTYRFGSTLNKSDLRCNMMETTNKYEMRIVNESEL